MKLWWRDDDAEVDDPRLDQLLAIAAGRDIPIVLATIPARLDAATTAKILASPRAMVVQHGLTHADHRGRDGKKCELVDRLDWDVALPAARQHLARTFGERFLPVMVPPWNRIEPGLRARLPSLGFSGLSTFASRCNSPEVPGLRLVDTHVDAIVWRDGRRPLDADSILQAVEKAAATAQGPLGLLTHHAVTDQEGFLALDRAIGLLQDRHEAEFVSGDVLFTRTGSN